MTSHVSAASAIQTIQRSLDDAIAARVFPGAALVVTRHGDIALEIYAGRFTYEQDSNPVTSDTVFDLASLTKVVATTSVAMSLFDQGKVDIDSRLIDVVPEVGGGDTQREQITFRQLLAHASGFPAHRKYYEEAKTADGLLKLVFATPLETAPGTRAEYSDIGFILLGLAFERIAGMPLNEACARKVFAPLSMASAHFSPLKQIENVAPTLEAVDFRQKRICGEVNDENAWVMGGVAGHAGLFGTAIDVSHFARCMLRGGRPLFKASTVELFTGKQSSPPGTSRALGWDTPTAPSQSGKYLSQRSYGHLGFTGTSLWIDPDRDVSITFLTNRTYPDNSSQEIKRVRPLIHDAVIEALHLQ